MFCITGRLCSSVTRPYAAARPMGRTLPRGGGFPRNFPRKGRPQGRPRTPKIARQRGKIYFDPFLGRPEGAPQGGFHVRPRKRGALLPPGGGMGFPCKISAPLLQSLGGPGSIGLPSPSNPSGTLGSLITLRLPPSDTHSSLRLTGSFSAPQTPSCPLTEMHT